MIKVSTHLETYKRGGKMILEYKGTNLKIHEDNKQLNYFPVQLCRKNKINKEEASLDIEFTLHDNSRYLGNFLTTELHQEINSEDGKSFVKLEYRQSFIDIDTIILDEEYIIFIGIIEINKIISEYDYRDEPYNYQIIFKYCETFEAILKEEGFSYLDFKNC